MFYNSPAAELVDEPPNDWAHEHVDAAEQASHPGHGAPVTVEMLHKWHQDQTKHIGDTWHSGDVSFCFQRMRIMNYIE